MRSVRPEALQDYLAHTTGGESLRSIARRHGCHPSSVMRRVARVEDARDDGAFEAWLQEMEAGWEPTADMPEGAHRFVRGVAPPPRWTEEGLDALVGLTRGTE